jgi:hypothetical protein
VKAQLVAVAAMGSVDRRVELAVTVSANRVGAIPGLASDRGRFWNWHAERLGPRGRRHVCFCRLATGKAVGETQSQAT